MDVVLLSDHWGLPQLPMFISDEILWAVLISSLSSHLNMHYLVILGEHEKNIKSLFHYLSWAIMVGLEVLLKFILFPCIQV